MIYPNIASLILRIGFGGLMISHGYGKFLQLISGDFSFPDPLGIGGGFTLFLAVLGEFVGPIFMMVGFKTKLAAIIPIATMAVAAFIVHANDALQNKELALIYFFAFFSIFCLGSGKYSVDHLIKKI